MKETRKHAIRKLVKAAKHAMKDCPPTTDGVNWKRSGDELDAARRRNLRGCGGGDE